MAAVRLLFTLALFSLLGGCQQETSLLRIGSNTWPGYEPMYVARELDLLEPANIRLVEMPDASAVMDGLRQGVLEGGALTLDEALLLASEGMDLTIIMICDQSQGADAVLAKPGILSLAGLKGQRIAAETSALGALMTTQLLQQAGLSREDVTIIPMNVNQQLEAYLAGDVDAVVTFTPVLNDLQELGARTLFTSADIPGQIVDVMVVHSDLVNRHKGALITLVRGFHQAWQQLQQQQPEALRYANQRLGLDDISSAWEGIHIPSLTQNLAFLQPPEKSQAAPVQQTAMQLHQILNNQDLLASGEYPPLHVTDAVVLGAMQ